MSADLARLLATVAADLDAVGYPAAGVVRQGARALAQCGHNHNHQQDGCPGCGSEVPQAERGRPRVWCSQRCRDRHRRRKSPQTSE